MTFAPGYGDSIDYLLASQTNPRIPSSCLVMKTESKTIPDLGVFSEESAQGIGLDLSRGVVEVVSPNHRKRNHGTKQSQYSHRSSLYQGKSLMKDYLCDSKLRAFQLLTRGGE